METEWILSLCIGIGLSAACGFRVFLPLQVMSIAAYAGHLNLAPGFEWIGSPAALAAFTVATTIEIAGYYVPWVDHLLDTMAAPAAFFAGSVATASMITDMSPFLRWTLAAIAGGGAASLVQGSTMLVRTISTATTAGIGNPVVATIELGGAVITSVMALVAPMLTLMALILLSFLIGRRLLRSRELKTSLESKRGQSRTTAY